MNSFRDIFALSSFFDKHVCHNVQINKGLGNAMLMRIFPYILSTTCHLATAAEIKPWERGCGKAGNCCALNNNIVYYTPVQGVYSYAITFYSFRLVGSIIF